MTICPECDKPIPLGGGSMRDGRRLHFWCARPERKLDDRGGETRLPSGATV